EDHDADADCQSLVDAQNPAAADLTSASASAYAEADADAGASATDTAPLATGEPALPSIQDAWAVSLARLPSLPSPLQTGSARRLLPAALSAAIGAGCALESVYGCCCLTRGIANRSSDGRLLVQQTQPAQDAAAGPCSILAERWVGSRLARPLHGCFCKPGETVTSPLFALSSLQRFFGTREMDNEDGAHRQKGERGKSARFLRLAASGQRIYEHQLSCQQLVLQLPSNKGGACLLPPLSAVWSSAALLASFVCALPIRPGTEGLASVSVSEANVEIAFALT
ncbi:hypothetical protein IWW45_007982, partial [Coemansia sp. RSA 485]